MASSDIPGTERHSVMRKRLMRWTTLDRNSMVWPILTDHLRMGYRLLSELLDCIRPPALEECWDIICSTFFTLLRALKQNSLKYIKIYLISLSFFQSWEDAQYICILPAVEKYLSAAATTTLLHNSEEVHKGGWFPTYVKPELLFNTFSLKSWPEGP